MFDESDKPSFVIDEKSLEKHPELAKIVPEKKDVKVEELHKKDVKSILNNSLLVPDIYFWVTYSFNGDPVTMTCAFKSTQHGTFGESWPIDVEWGKAKRRANEKLLMKKVVESLRVIVHFGGMVLDSNGNIDPVKVNDKVAERYFYDKLWKARMDAFNKVVRVKAINIVKARELQLL